MNGNQRVRPAQVLIVVGGFAGTGKTAISRRLSAKLTVPRLGSDTIGRTIRASAGMEAGEANAYWIAYDVLFRLCEEFIQAGVSVVVDITLGWSFQWEHLDGIVTRHPETVFLPIVLRCSYDTCIERLRQRYEAHPATYDPPAVYQTEPKMRSIWACLAKLDRSDVRFIAAGRPHEDVYAEVLGYVSTRLSGQSIQGRA